MSRTSSRPITVLLVEDDEGQAILTQGALEREGFTVEVCRTGRDALGRIVNQEYDVHLIDLKLPDLSGVEVLRRIHALKPGAICIIVSGHGDELAAVEAMKQGASDYIAKSAQMAHLAALPLVIREVLDRRRLKHEREELQNELWEQARLLEERNIELRRANDELNRLNQLKSDLVSMVSHELRTPMTTVKEFIGIIADELAGPLTSEQRQHLGTVRENIDRLVRIINDLLDMAKIEAGRLLLTRTLLEPAALLEHICASLRPLAQGKGLTLAVQRPPAPLAVFADGDKVTQVLLNLVSNAIKFTAPGGRVTVGLTERPTEVAFSVTDTGVGIPPAELPRLFEKFSQLAPRPLPGGTSLRGTGLGLAISKRLVELHGGTIAVTSTPGQGSTFTFTLPRHQPEEVFREALRGGLEQARRQQTGFSIGVIALANFPQLQALYGVEEATRLLRALEGRIREVLRSRAGDLVTRWHRGEVVVFLKETGRADCQAMTAGITQAIKGWTVEINGKTLSIPIEAVTATYPDEALTEEELLQVTEARLRALTSRTLRILVVDDEPKIRQFLKGALEMHAYQVLTASDGEQALAILKDEPVDLILLDLMMPGIDGYEVNRLLKADPKMREIPVIIVTAKGNRQDREAGLQHAAYNYVAKPFDLEDLLARIRDTLVRSRLPAGRQAGKG
jgi:signal transduction histidine kinase